MLAVAAAAADTAGGDGNGSENGNGNGGGDEKGPGSADSQHGAAAEHLAAAGRQNPPALEQAAAAGLSPVLGPVAAPAPAAAPAAADTAGEEDGDGVEVMLHSADVQQGAAAERMGQTELQQSLAWAAAAAGAKPMQRTTAAGDVDGTMIDRAESQGGAAAGHLAAAALQGFLLGQRAEDPASPEPVSAAGAAATETWDGAIRRSADGQEGSAGGALTAAVQREDQQRSAAAAAADGDGEVTCSTDSQQGAAPERMTLSELQQHLARTRLSTDTLGRCYTVLNKLLQLGGLDAAATQAADLLQQCWPLLHSWLLGDPAPMKPQSAIRNYINYTQDMLSLPKVQALFGQQQLRELQHAVEATRAALANKKHTDMAAAVAPPASAQQHRKASKHARLQQSAAADGATMRAVADSHRLRKVQRQHPKAPAARVYTQSPSGSDSEQHPGDAGPWRKMRSTWRRLSDAAAEGPAQAAAAAAAGPSQIDVARCAQDAAPAGDAGRSPQPRDCSAVRTRSRGTGLTLKQLTQQLQGERISDRVSPFRMLAQELSRQRKEECDESAVQVKDLLLHWDLLEQRLLQQVAGTHPSLNQLNTCTALNYVGRAQGLLSETIVRAQFAPEELQRVQDSIKATRAALNAQVAPDAAQQAPQLQQARQQASTATHRATAAPAAAPVLGKRPRGADAAAADAVPGRRLPSRAAAAALKAVAAASRIAAAARRAAPAAPAAAAAAGRTTAASSRGAAAVPRAAAATAETAAAAAQGLSLQQLEQQTPGP